MSSKAPGTNEGGKVRCRAGRKSLQEQKSGCRKASIISEREITTRSLSQSSSLNRTDRLGIFESFRKICENSPNDILYKKMQGITTEEEHLENSTKQIEKNIATASEHSSSINKGEILEIVLDEESSTEDCVIAKNDVAEKTPCSKLSDKKRIKINRNFTPRATDLPPVKNKSFKRTSNSWRRRGPVSTNEPNVQVNDERTKPESEECKTPISSFTKEDDSHINQLGNILVHSSLKNALLKIPVSSTAVRTPVICLNKVSLDPTSVVDVSSESNDESDLESSERLKSVTFPANSFGSVCKFVKLEDKFEKIEDSTTKESTILDWASKSSPVLPSQENKDFSDQISYDYHENLSEAGPMQAETVKNKLIQPVLEFLGRSSDTDHSSVHSEDKESEYSPNKSPDKITQVQELCPVETDDRKPNGGQSDHRKTLKKQSPQPSKCSKPSTMLKRDIDSSETTFQRNSPSKVVQKNKLLSASKPSSPPDGPSCIRKKGRSPRQTTKLKRTRTPNSNLPRCSPRARRNTLRGEDYLASRKKKRNSNSECYSSPERCERSESLTPTTSPKIKDSCSSKGISPTEPLNLHCSTTITEEKGKTKVTTDIQKSTGEADIKNDRKCVTSVAAKLDKNESIVQVANQPNQHLKCQEKDAQGACQDDTPQCERPDVPKSPKKKLGRPRKNQDASPSKNCSPTKDGSPSKDDSPSKDGSTSNTPVNKESRWKRISKELPEGLDIDVVYAWTSDKKIRKQRNPKTKTSPKIARDKNENCVKHADGCQSETIREDLKGLDNISIDVAYTGTQDLKAAAENLENTALDLSNSDIKDQRLELSKLTSETLSESEVPAVRLEESLLKLPTTELELNVSFGSQEGSLDPLMQSPVRSRSGRAIKLTSAAREAGLAHESTMSFLVGVAAGDKKSKGQKGLDSSFEFSGSSREASPEKPLSPEPSLPIKTQKVKSPKKQKISEMLSLAAQDALDPGSLTEKVSPSVVSMLNNKRGRKAITTPNIGSDINLSIGSQSTTPKKKSPGKKRTIRQILNIKEEDLNVDMPPLKTGISCSKSELCKHLLGQSGPVQSLPNVPNQFKTNEYNSEPENVSNSKDSKAKNTETRSNTESTVHNKTDSELAHSSQRKDCGKSDSNDKGANLVNNLNSPSQTPTAEELPFKGNVKETETCDNDDKTSNKYNISSGLFENVELENEQASDSKCTSRESKVKLISNTSDDRVEVSVDKPSTSSDTATKDSNSKGINLGVHSNGEMAPSSEALPQIHAENRVNVERSDKLNKANITESEKEIHDSSRETDTNKHSALTNLIAQVETRVVEGKDEGTRETSLEESFTSKSSSEVDSSLNTSSEGSSDKNTSANSSSSSLNTSAETSLNTTDGYEEGKAPDSSTTAATEDKFQCDKDNCSDIIDPNIQSSTQGSMVDIFLPSQTQDYEIASNNEKNNLDKRQNSNSSRHDLGYVPLCSVTDKNKNSSSPGEKLKVTGQEKETGVSISKATVKEEQCDGISRGNAERVQGKSQRQKLILNPESEDEREQFRQQLERLDRYLLDLKAYKSQKGIKSKGVMSDGEVSERRHSATKKEINLYHETSFSHGISVKSEPEDTLYTKKESPGDFTIKEEALSPSQSPSIEQNPHTVFEKPGNLEAKRVFAFHSSELESYLTTNREVKQNYKQDPELFKEPDPIKHFKSLERGILRSNEPDVDEIDGVVFLSFDCDRDLKEYIKLTGTRMPASRVRPPDPNTSLIKQEIKPPDKTLDVKKIKGWKKKFVTDHANSETGSVSDLYNEDSNESNLDSSPYCPSRNIKVSPTPEGAINSMLKIHWRTKEKLLRNLSTEEISSLGLSLKRRRAKKKTPGIRGRGRWKQESTEPLEIEELGAPKPRARRTLMPKLNLHPVTLTDDMVLEAVEALVEIEYDGETGRTVENESNFSLCGLKACRFGCICKQSDNSEEMNPVGSETSLTLSQPTCAKEYCRNGCICDCLESAEENAGQNVDDCQTKDNIQPENDSKTEVNAFQSRDDWVKAEMNRDPNYIPNYDYMYRGRGKGRGRGRGRGKYGKRGPYKLKNRENDPNKKPGFRGRGKRRAHRMAVEMEVERHNQESMQDLSDQKDHVAKESDPQQGAYLEMFGLAKRDEPKGKKISGSTDVRKSNRLKNRKGIGNIDKLKDLIYFDATKWVDDDKKRMKRPLGPGRKGQGIRKRKCLEVPDETLKIDQNESSAIGPSNFAEKRSVKSYPAQKHGKHTKNVLQNTGHDRESLDQASLKIRRRRYIRNKHAYAEWDRGKRVQGMVYTIMRAPSDAPGPEEANDDSSEGEEDIGVCARSSVYLTNKVLSARTQCPSELKDKAKKPVLGPAKTSASLSTRPSVDKKPVSWTPPEPSYTVLNHPAAVEEKPRDPTPDEQGPRVRKQMVLLQRNHAKQFQGPQPGNKVKEQSEEEKPPHLLEIQSNCDWADIRSLLLHQISIVADKEELPPEGHKLCRKILDYTVEIRPPSKEMTPLPNNLKTEKFQSLPAIRINITKNFPAAKKQEQNLPAEGNKTQRKLLQPKPDTHSSQICAEKNQNRQETVSLQVQVPDSSEQPADDAGKSGDKNELSASQPKITGRLQEEKVRNGPKDISLIKERLPLISGFEGLSGLSRLKINTGGSVRNISGNIISLKDGNGTAESIIPTSGFQTPDGKISVSSYPDTPFSKDGEIKTENIPTNSNTAPKIFFKQTNAGTIRVPLIQPNPGGVTTKGIAPGVYPITLESGATPRISLQTANGQQIRIPLNMVHKNKTSIALHPKVTLQLGSNAHLIPSPQSDSKKGNSIIQTQPSIEGAKNTTSEEILSDGVPSAEGRAGVKADNSSKIKKSATVHDPKEKETEIGNIAPIAIIEPIKQVQKRMSPRKRGRLSDPKGADQSPSPTQTSKQTPLRDKLNKKMKKESTNQVNKAENANECNTNAYEKAEKIPSPGLQNSSRVRSPLLFQDEGDYEFDRSSPGLDLVEDTVQIISNPPSIDGDEEDNDPIEILSNQDEESVTDLEEADIETPSLGINNTTLKPPKSDTSRKMENKIKGKSAEGKEKIDNQRICDDINQDENASAYLNSPPSNNKLDIDSHPVSVISFNNQNSGVHSPKYIKEEINSQDEQIVIESSDDEDIDCEGISDDENSGMTRAQLLASDMSYEQSPQTREPPSPGLLSVSKEALDSMSPRLKALIIREKMDRRKWRHRYSHLKKQPEVKSIQQARNNEEHVARERVRRLDLVMKFDNLRRVVPRQFLPLPTADKLSKHAVLIGACQVIEWLTKKEKSLKEEKNRLLTYNQLLQKAVRTMKGEKDTKSGIEISETLEKHFDDVIRRHCLPKAKADKKDDPTLSTEVQTVASTSSSSAPAAIKRRRPKEWGPRCKRQKSTESCNVGKTQNEDSKEQNTPRRISKNTEDTSAESKGITVSSIYSLVRQGENAPSPSEKNYTDQSLQKQETVSISSGSINNDENALSLADEDSNDYLSSRSQSTINDEDVKDS